ncbi:MAG: hypothetical protein H0Z29_06030 [Candidatus Marinimicrobia bacterium]|nr:hypothetical protein [Candidatus Neomarinimicrobiota bacterium]
MTYYEKKTIIFTVTIAIPIGFLLSITTTKLPNIMEYAYNRMSNGKNINYDGSAVKKETALQKQYEETYRKKLNPDWDKEYKTILYNSKTDSL